MEHDQTRNSPPAGPQAGGGEETTAASKSLADALHVSFRLLSLIVIGSLLWLLIFTGMASVQPEQRAVRLVFGQIQGEADRRVLGEGLKWSWPEPIGRILRISTEVRSLAVNDFWMFERAEDLDKPLSERRAAAEGLRPGWDGALMTGDRGLIHVGLMCKFKTGVRAGRPDPQAVTDYLHNVPEADDYLQKLRETNEVVRSAVCNAAIHAAAARTLDSILVADQEGFVRAVRERAQARLDEIRAGIDVQSIEVTKTTVPLKAIAAFDAVANARTEWETRMNQAKGDAIGMLTGAAGGSWRILSGDLEAQARPGAETSPPPDQPQGAGALPPRLQRVELFRRYARAARENDKQALEELAKRLRRFGLLNLYAAARERRDETLSEQVLEEIDRVLISNRTGGASATIINGARAYSAGIRQRVKARAALFGQLVDKFQDTPELMLERLWANAKTEILTNPQLEKIYVPPNQKMVLRVTSDPKVKRRILRETLRAKTEARDARGYQRPLRRPMKPSGTGH